MIVILYHILTYLRSVDDTRVYIFICKCVQTGVIYWAEEGPKYNVILTIIFFFLIFIFIFFYFHG